MTVWSQDGDIIPLGGDEALTVMYTPGHSPDSITLWDPAVRAFAMLSLLEAPPRSWSVLNGVGCFFG